MSLFTPDSGLLFWMLLSFGVVFFVLAKYGFPVITRMVEERKAYIDQSLDAAREANEQLNHIKSECELILKQAREEQMKILKDARETSERIIGDARIKADNEGFRLIEEARVQIQQEKERAMNEICRQTAELSVLIAEKIIRKNLDNEQQQIELIERMIDEEKIKTNLT